MSTQKQWSVVAAAGSLVAGCLLAGCQHAPQTFGPSQSNRSDRQLTAADAMSPGIHDAPATADALGGEWGAAHNAGGAAAGPWKPGGAGKDSAAVQRNLSGVDVSQKVAE